jgi:hypothetical protein
LSVSESERSIVGRGGEGKLTSSFLRLSIPFLALRILPPLRSSLVCSDGRSPVVLVALLSASCDVFAFAFTFATAAFWLLCRYMTSRNNSHTFSWARGGDSSSSHSIWLFGPDGAAAGCPAAASSRSRTSGSRDSRLGLSAAGRDCIGGGGGGGTIAEGGGVGGEEGRGSGKERGGGAVHRVVEIARWNF